MSRDARIVDQVVSTQGTFQTPAGDGLPMPKISAFSVDRKVIYVKQAIKANVTVKNPAKKALSGLSLELYHTTMSPSTLIDTKPAVNIGAGASALTTFDVQAPWVGQMELLAVLKKEGKIIDTSSLILEILPKIFLVDCAHGNFDYYVGRFSGMKMDLAKTMGFEFHSISKPINAQTLKDAFVVTIPDPDKPFAPDEVAALKEFVGKGGSLLLFCRADYNNRSHPQLTNELLRAIGSNLRFNDDEVCDPTNNIGYPWGLFITTFPDPLITGVKQLLVRSCCSLLNAKMEGLKARKNLHILATGDEDCYNINADSLDDAWLYASHTPKLPIPIAACEDLGAGRVALIGETLYDDKLYSPTSQLPTPLFNRTIIAWLSAAKEKKLRELIESASLLNDVEDPEARAIRYEGLKTRIVEIGRQMVSEGDSQSLLSEFQGHADPAAQTLLRDVKSMIEFPTLHQDPSAGAADAR